MGLTPPKPYVFTVDPHDPGHLSIDASGEIIVHGQRFGLPPQPKYFTDLATCTFPRRIAGGALVLLGAGRGLFGTIIARYRHRHRGRCYLFRLIVPPPCRHPWWDLRDPPLPPPDPDDLDPAPDLDDFDPDDF